MKITVKLGAKADGTLTAFQIRNVSNTGAYGNHGGETLFAGGAAMAHYRCPNKKSTATRSTRTRCPAVHLRGYGMTQPSFAVESAMTELALALGMDPLELRRRNVIRPGDCLLAIGEHPNDVSFTEDGLTECIDLVDGALQRHADGTRSGRGLAHRRGTASSIHETAPPTDHVSDAWATLREEASTRSQSAQSNSARERQRRTCRSRPASSAPPRRGYTWCSPTPTGPVSTPGHSPARDCSSRGTRYKRRRPRCGIACCTSPLDTRASTSTSCSMDNHGVKCGDRAADD